ncbi:MAG: dipeptidase [Anaerolineales bacterium]|nr:dipeptidase [Anaerolineales bacterium]
MRKKIKAAIEYVNENQDRFFNELAEYIAFPSVSADSLYKQDIRSCAEWSAKKMKEAGLTNVQVIPAIGNPFVFGEYKCGKSEAPTLLFYGHYDVQPVDPENLWNTPPFEATLIGENLYGRGTSDMKGQILACLNGLEATLHQGDLNVNVKFMLEGEEETSSPSMVSFLTEYKELLKSDVSINPDSGMISKELPAINYALRGIAAFEIIIRGPKVDLHSGGYGGAVLNPANELARLLAGMHDNDWKVTLPGFYDKVRPLDEKERQELTRLPKSDNTFLEQTGSPSLWGETGYSAVERTGGRPTMDVNGITSGYGGEGPKTIIPAVASAKISFRLVPDQDPAEVKQQLIKYMEQNVRPGVTWEVKEQGSGKPSICDLDSKFVQLTADALESAWGVRPGFDRVGGSIPIVGQMQEYLGIDSVLTGFGLPDDAVHSPNEKLHIPTWMKGIEAIIYLLLNAK